MSKQSESRRTKKSTAFRIGRVRAYLRGRVWYLCYHEDRRPSPGRHLRARDFGSAGWVVQTDCSRPRRSDGQCSRAAGIVDDFVD